MHTHIHTQSYTQLPSHSNTQAYGRSYDGYGVLHAMPLYHIAMYTKTITKSVFFPVKSMFFVQRLHLLKLFVYTYFEHQAHYASCWLIDSTQKWKKKINEKKRSGAIECKKRMTKKERGREKEKEKGRVTHTHTCTITSRKNRKK